MVLEILLDPATQAWLERKANAESASTSDVAASVLEHERLLEENRLRFKEMLEASLASGSRPASEFLADLKTKLSDAST